MQADVHPEGRMRPSNLLMPCIYIPILPEKYAGLVSYMTESNNDVNQVRRTAWGN